MPRPCCLRRLFAALILTALLLPAFCLAGDTPPLLLANVYSGRHDVTQYLVSEKLDGVRAYWDGKQLTFRSGKPIHAPSWFTARFPSHPLDGELWMGRRRFEQVSAAVRRLQPVDTEWQAISYQVFELPGGEGTFAERVAALQASVAQANLPWLQAVKQERIADETALMQKLAQVVQAGGEGLMLHRADAQWQSGRSDVLLKLKPQHDAEAVVIAHEAGKGKYAGMLGALVVRTADGKHLRLGSGFTEAQRAAPPPIGSIVTYRYRDLSANGMPRFATFLRIREPE